MKKLINFKHIKEDQQLFFLFSVSFLATLFIPNNKFYVLLFLFFGIVLFFYLKKSLWETFFLTFIFSLPFENNLREWIFEITPPLFKLIPTSGYSLHFGINIKSILAFGLFLLTILKNRKIEKKPLKNSLFLLIFLLLACINTYFFGQRNVFPILGLIRIWIATLIFITSIIYFSNHKKTFHIFIIALYLYSITIGSLQFIRQKPLGKYIELSPDFSQEFGYSTTDGNKQFRVSGFISHPVYFASFLSMLLPIYMGIILDRFKQEKISKKKLIAIIPVVIGSFVILGTLSRSAFFTLFLSLFLFRKAIFNKIIRPLLQIKNLKHILFLIFSLLITFIIIFTAPRIKSFLLLFTENGNASIRIQLIKTSFKMIYQNPFGIGLNNFTNELVKFDIPQSLYGFIVPVHNTFLIFFTELSIPAGIIFIIFLFSIFLKNFNKNKKDIINYSIWIGILTFIINSQIHPLFNLDPTFDLLMVVLAYYSTWT